MGEYFAAVLLNEDYEPFGYWYPHNFGTIYTRETGSALPIHIGGEGAKLMEHSYVGGRMVDAVCSVIRRVPMRVGWLGDYTTEENVPPSLPGLVDAVHGGGHIAWMRELPVPVPENIDEGQWLLNLDKETAFRIPYRDEYGKWTPHPLPLLTSTDGSPTYHPKEETPALDMIGTWKWDRVTIAARVPEGYEAVGSFFPNDI